MTCVLPTTPWHHFNDHLPWLPMNSETTPSQSSLDQKAHSQGYVSPDGSDTRKSSTSSTKKRASRAGTRSVTTLSAAQLERKRANDREAQRAIRQRTKDHIDHLERTVNDLRSSQEQHEKMVHATQQRNRELEEENAYLRTKLNEAGFNLSIIPDGQRSQESVLLSVPATSPNTVGASIPRPESTSAPSSHSGTTQSSSSRHSPWQHNTGFVSTTMGSAPAPNMTAWRSHDNPQSLQPIQTSPDPMQGPVSASYTHDERVDWAGAPSAYQYVTQDQQRGQYETAPSQQGGYQPAPYHPQEFPSISVSSSPNSYQVQNQSTFQPQAPFHVTPMQVPANSTEYTSPSTMHPPHLAGPSFQPSSGEASYGQPQSAAMQYRDEGANRSYSLSHYSAA